ncbi:MAG: hypothetical protein WDA42_07330, partial [Candidatus Bathyarchaeia archaeon]
MDLSEQTQNKQKQRRLNRALEAVRTVIVTLLPLVAAVVFQITDSAILGSLGLIAFVVYVVTYYIFVFSRQAQDSILPWRIEDWLVAIFPPTLVLFSFFQAINTTTYLLLCCSLFLLVGVKSTYETPQMLVQVLNGKDNFNRNQPPLKRYDVNLS